MLMKRTHDFCKRRKWKRDWTNGGVYLHLEASEFIEALRGKGDPEEEAGDVLFVLTSMMEEAGLEPERVLARLEEKLASMDAGTYVKKAA